MALGRSVAVPEIEDVVFFDDGVGLDIEALDGRLVGKAFRGDVAAVAVGAVLETMEGALDFVAADGALAQAGATVGTFIFDGIGLTIARAEESEAAIEADGADNLAAFDAVAVHDGIPLVFDHRNLLFAYILHTLIIRGLGGKAPNR